MGSTIRPFKVNCLAHATKKSAHGVGRSFADGVIAFYDAKYTYNFWRPGTAHFDTKAAGGGRP
jgi:hypothetical protein